MSTLLELAIGQEAQVEGFSDPLLEMRLLELGCVPGTSVLIERQTPWHGPLILTINHDYQLALRRQEASLVRVSPIHPNA